MDSGKVLIRKKLLKTRDAYTHIDFGMRVMGSGAPPGISKTLKLLYDIWVGFVIVFAVVYVPVGFLIPFVMDFSNITPSELFQSLELFFNMPACSLKIVILLINTKESNRAKDLLDVMYERCTPKQKDHINAFALRCNKIVIFYVIMYLMCPTLMFLSSVLAGNIPWGLYNPFLNWRDSEANFWKAAFLEFSILLVAVYGNAIVDCMPFIFGLTVREHIKLTKERVERLRENTESTDLEDFEELTLCIKDHKMILEYCEIMRPIISRSMFVQFAAIGLVLACTLIHLIFFSTFLSGLSSVWYMSACQFQSFPFSYTCDKINDDLDDLGAALFHSKWLDAKRSYKLAMIYFMHNTQRPIEFLGGGVLPICLNTNVRMVKMAFSLITFVRQLNIFDTL